MKQTQIFPCFVIFCLCFWHGPSSTFFVVSSSDSQPALIPTYRTSTSTAEKLVSEPLRLNVYSESLDSVTTTIPFVNTTEYSEPIDDDNEYSVSTEPGVESSSLDADSDSQPSSLPMEPIAKFVSELKNEEPLKPEAYINSIVNPEPYSKYLEFDEKPKEKPDVRVTIYHHQGISDPVGNYGSGKPWNFYGTGYGIHYEHNKDGSYGREKGYQFEKAHGRDFCDKKNCHNAQPNEAHEKAAASEVKKSPIENHVEGVLKHNNVDIQNWYREGNHKPTTSKPHITTPKPESVFISSKVPISHGQKRLQTLPKISSFIPATVPADYYTPKPEVNYYSNFKREPEIRRPSSFPRDYHFAHSETVRTHRPEMKQNRYSLQYTPKYNKRPHSHIHSDFHSNNNNFRNVNFKRPVFKRKAQQTVPHYNSPPNNDFFNFEQNFWPNTFTKPAHNVGHTPIYAGSTFMPRYANYGGPYGRILFPNTPTFHGGFFNWNPYA